MARKTKCDFSDPDAVLEHMAKELEYEPDSLSIKEDKGLGSFISDTVYRIECGKKEWFVVESDDIERELALAVVIQDLEQEPEIFEQNWLQGHINEDRLRRDLHSDVESGNVDYFNDQSDDDLIREAGSYGVDGEKYIEQDEDGEEQLDDRDGLIEALAEAKTEEDLKDPIAYLQEIYGDSDGLKQAVEIGGIDAQAAAEDAVDTDGAGHFLSHYDGNTHESACGFVWWRGN